jgi:hypothetical protein
MEDQPMIVEFGQRMTCLNKPEGHTHEYADGGTVSDKVQMIAGMVIESQSRAAHKGSGQSAVKSVFENRLKAVFLRSNPTRIHPTGKTYEKHYRN